MYVVKHRTAGEGLQAPGPWRTVGPFGTYAEAKTAWDEIRPGWQEGGVYLKCDHCGELKRVRA